jgi:hypothetical protein
MIARMADGKKPSPKEIEASRRFLAQLLYDCRRTNWPGCADMLKLIEEAMANLPPEPADPQDENNPRKPTLPGK